MTKEIECALAEWRFSRGNTIAFIKALGNDGLNEKLPRPGLDTFAKHFQEMIDVQKAYIEAIETGTMSFAQMAGGYDDNIDEDGLLKMMEEVDQKLERILENVSFTKEIIWDDNDRKTVCSQLCALSSHEIFHIGQLVAFCYASHRPIPEEVVTNWALPVQ